MEKLQTGQMIEWEDLDKKRFYVIGPSLFLLVRGLIYPFNLVKTRLFMQHQRSLYSGTVDAFKKVVQREGVGGLYKGFAFSSLGMISGQIYLTTYELVRGYMKGYRSEVKGLVAGGTATLVAQSLTVPIDIVTQIMMMQGQAGGIRALKNKRNYVLVKNVDYIIPHREVVKLRGAVTIVRDILQREGVRGLYRGYHVSLLTYAPNSALWWAFYAGFYRKSMEYGWLSSGQVPIPLVQASCGVLSGLLAAILTNPLDVFRTRYQLESHTLKKTFINLWREEGISFLKKGLSARIVSTGPTSALLIVSYEWVKRMSLKQ